MLKKAIQYCWYKISAPHKRGFGIHSPFVYKLVSEVLIRKDDEGLRMIKEWRRLLSKKTESIETNDFGAGSKTHPQKLRQVRDILRKSSISHKYGRILYYLSGTFKPASILELGTGLGISTAYLAKGNPQARVISIDADKTKCSYAENSLKLLEIRSPEIINGSFEEVLLSKLKSAEHPLLIFVDGDHRYEAVLKYFSLLKEFKRPDTIIVFDDIRWSEDMEKAWKEIKACKETVLSIDLFLSGIIFFREGVVKQDFMVNF